MPLYTKCVRFTSAALLCLLLATAAHAQFTTVSGTIADSNGIPYAPATIKAQLVLAGSNVTGQPTLTINSSAQCKASGYGSAPCQVPFPGTVGPFAMDSTGSFTVNLPDNTQVTPASTQWLFTVNTAGTPQPVGTGPQTCAATISISGASQSISASFSCPALARGAGGGSFQGTFNNNASSVDQFNVTLLGGNANCPEQSIIGGGFVTSAITGCVNIPTSGVTNGFSSAVTGLVNVANPNQTGQFVRVEGVGGFFVARCAANNTVCIGMSPQVESNAGLTGVFMEGFEADVFPLNTTDVGTGLLMVAGNGVGVTQPTSDNMPAIKTQSNSASFLWTAGYECADASVIQDCVHVGKISAAGNSNSQTIDFFSSTGSAFINLNRGGFFVHTNPEEISNPTGPESRSIALTATAALSANQLVKVDTANADSVVVCGIADTTACMGFVQDQASSNNCTAGNTFCPIVATPGSKVLGILGTATCAIGNNVIVDTTTPGRIKCQAGIPAQGAWIGIALSAQATVGNTVDILTKFQ